jgi:hypothetical protein
MRRSVKLGSNVYVPNPQRFVSDCVSITGNVVQVVKREYGDYCVLDGYVAKIGGGSPISVAFPIEDLGVRIGTPVSKISTRPGQPGYDQWLRICRSWGHP